MNYIFSKYIISCIFDIFSKDYILSIISYQKFWFIDINHNFIKFIKKILISSIIIETIEVKLMRIRNNKTDMITKNITNYNQKIS